MIATTGMLMGEVAVLVAGMVLLGVGNGGAQLSRYAAADLVPPRRRGLALGTVVWAGTIGGLVGPLVLAPSAVLAQHLSAPPLAGAFAVALLTAAATGLVSAVLPQHTSPTAAASGAVAGPASTPTPDTRIGPTAATSLIGLLRSPVVRVAISAMVTAQVVMVAILTMTPLFLHQHAHGLHTVGQVLAAHSGDPARLRLEPVLRRRQLAARRLAARRRGSPRRGSP